MKGASAWPPSPPDRFAAHLAKLVVGFNREEGEGEVAEELGVAGLFNACYVPRLNKVPNLAAALENRPDRMKDLGVGRLGTLRETSGVVLSVGHSVQ